MTLKRMRWVSHGKPDLILVLELVKLAGETEGLEDQRRQRVGNPQLTSS
jgi:hypothetical protein